VGPPKGKANRHCNIDLEAEAATLLQVQGLASQVNGAKIVMYGSSLDERALTEMHQIIKHQSKSTGKAFGN
jgi:hypothetical protein